MPLLRVQHATAVRRGGLPPSCTIAIRLYDRRDLVIRTGDCAVLPQAPSEGLRRLRRDVRIRRAAIPPSAVPAVIAGWHAAAPHAAGRESISTTTPVVHLLRVGRESCERAADWQQWGERLRDAGGAVVILGEPPARHSAPLRVRRAYGASGRK